MTSTCACGTIEISIKKTPDFIFDCNCSLCRKVGAAWGYFKSADVSVLGHTASYSRVDTSTPIVEIHSCKVCSATTHFVLTDAYQAKFPDIDQVGVNMRLFDPEALVGVDVQYPNGKDWSGDGPFGFRRNAMTISDEHPW
ncbi:MAG: aldehyde-activating protein [Pseudomonadota bacterium]